MKIWRINTYLSIGHPSRMNNYNVIPFLFLLAPPLSLLSSSLDPLTFQSQALCLESKKSVILTLLVGELFIIRIFSKFRYLLQIFSPCIQEMAWAICLLGVAFLSSPWHPLTQSQISSFYTGIVLSSNLFPSGDLFLKQ